MKCNEYASIITSLLFMNTSLLQKEGIINHYYTFQTPEFEGVKNTEIQAGNAEQTRLHRTMRGRSLAELGRAAPGGWSEANTRAQSNTEAQMHTDAGLLCRSHAGLILAGQSGGATDSWQPAGPQGGPVVATMRLQAEFCKGKMELGVRVLCQKN